MRTRSAFLPLFELLFPFCPLAIELFLNPVFPVENHPTCVAVQENLMAPSAEESALVLFEVEIGGMALGTAHTERHEARVSGREWNEGAVYLDDTAQSAIGEEHRRGGWVVRRLWRRWWAEER